VPGIKAIDHLALPVNDIQKAEHFYVDLLGMELEMRRFNPNGKPRQTYVNNGSQIGLFLPGTPAPATTTGAPRLGILYPDRRVLEAVLEQLKQEAILFEGPVGDSCIPGIECAVLLDDPAGNHLDLCVLKETIPDTGISHLILETARPETAREFYLHAISLEEALQREGEICFAFESGQFIVLKSVPQLSQRTRLAGRGVHFALEVTHQSFEETVKLIEQYGGAVEGDPRAADGLRPADEKSTYFSDPDGNPFQMSAFSATRTGSLCDEDRWKRIQENRAQQGRKLARWEIE